MVVVFAILFTMVLLTSRRGDCHLVTAHMLALLLSSPFIRGQGDVCSPKQKQVILPASVQVPGLPAVLPLVCFERDPGCHCYPCRFSPTLPSHQSLTVDYSTISGERDDGERFPGQVCMHGRGVYLEAAMESRACLLQAPCSCGSRLAAIDSRRFVCLLDWKKRNTERRCPILDCTDDGACSGEPGSLSADKFA